MNTELSKERDFGRYVQAAAKEYRKVREAVSGEAGGSVARQLYAYVRDNYAWNGVQAACASGRVADLVRSREGSSADLNLFLAGLLCAAGTDAVPVLLRVRGSGSVEREAPSKDAFNDVVIRVTDEEGVHFLDASERFAGFGELPARCADMEGLVAEPDTEEWVMLSQEQVAFDGREVGIVVDTAGIADVSVVRTFDGAAAMNLRSGCRRVCRCACPDGGRGGGGIRRPDGGVRRTREAARGTVCLYGGGGAGRGRDTAPCPLRGGLPRGQSVRTDDRPALSGRYRFQTRGCLSGAYRNSTGVPGEKPAVRHESRRRNLPVHV